MTFIELITKVRSIKTDLLDIEGFRVSHLDKGPLNDAIYKVSHLLVSLEDKHQEAVCDNSPVVTFDVY